MDHQFDGLYRILIIGQRFSHSHQDDIGDGGLLRQSSLYSKNLVDDLCSGEVPFKTDFTGQAEPASHGTTHLSGKAEGQPPFIRDEDTFNAIPILKMEKKFPCSISALFRPEQWKVRDEGDLA